MMMLPNGEIRSYGAIIHAHDDYTFVVQKSDDYGMSWRTEVVSNLTTPGACVQSPWSGDWLRLKNYAIWRYDAPRPQLTGDLFPPVMQTLPSEGLWLFRSKSGPDGEFVPEKISDESVHIQRLPLPLKHRQRWIIPAEQKIDGFTHPVVFFSDDDGKSWQKRILPYPPLHELKWPHKGYRWRQPGVEPVIAEHTDGTLQMLLRTSQDFHYQCFSQDGGESWTPPEPSPFYSVATMPNLLTLKDGRLLAVWNNTTPLPEVDHKMQAELDEYTQEGGWEDVFTNRDVLHAAISDDNGRTWRGYREIALNPLRNEADFRTRGGNYAMFDRSVHQNQAIELPDNKVLVGYGQHPECWGYVVFDLAWLDESSRTEDFHRGLENWCIHQYMKSRSGGYSGRGHCAWNRRPGASLMPAPDGSFREALLIARHPDSRLVFEKEGAVWNFPATTKGKIELNLRMMPGTAGLRITLCDRWFNPVDPVVDQLSPFVVELDAIGRINKTPAIQVGADTTLVIEFDQDAKQASVHCNAVTVSVPLTYAVPNAISYLHLQSLADNADPFGVMIYDVKMEKL
jgi:hypothetical protein